MHSIAKDIAAKSSLDFDVCIMGGGAAGITIAHELLGSGIKVCVLESGDLEFSDATQAFYEAQEVKKGFPDPHWSRLRYWGGSTNHWEGNCSPLSDSDFQYRDYIPNSGWPIGRDDLDPFYRRANVYCELGEYNPDPAYWQARSHKATLDLSGAQLQTGIVKSSSPTRFGEVWGPALTSSEDVTVITGANAKTVAFDKKTDSVATVDIQSLEGNQFSIRAKKFILCMGGIENARMLRFWNEQNEDRLGNQGDCVGRYFMDHPIVEGAFFLPLRPREEFGFYKPHKIDGQAVAGFWELSPEALAAHEISNIRLPFVPVSKLYASDGVSSLHILKDGEAGGHLWRHLRNVITDLDMIAESGMRRKFGREIFSDADEFSGYVFDTMLEQTPDPVNRIRLTSDLDALGIPKIAIDWRVSDADKERTWKAYEVMAREAGRLGLGRVRLLREREGRMWQSQLGFGHHHMGTTRMGQNPGHSVVDANTKVFGTRNLYVAGSSVFATGGHVPPTLTLVALAVRLSDHIKQQFGEGL